MVALISKPQGHVGGWVALNERVCQTQHWVLSVCYYARIVEKRRLNLLRLTRPLHGENDDIIEFKANLNVCNLNVRSLERRGQCWSSPSKLSRRYSINWKDVIIKRSIINRETKVLSCSAVCNHVGGKTEFKARNITVKRVGWCKLTRRTDKVLERYRMIWSSNSLTFSADMKKHEVRARYLWNWMSKDRVWCIKTIT
jgi:hypothetical protein